MFEWGEEDPPADLAQELLYMCCSINKASSEDHRGGKVRGLRLRREAFGFMAHEHPQTGSYF